MTESKKYRELSELGEFGLIEHLTKDIKLKNKSSIKGIGDDAAVLNYNRNAYSRNSFRLNIHTT